MEVLQQLQAATAGGIDTDGDSLRAAAALFRIWLPGDPETLVAPRSLFQAVDAAGSAADWEAATASLAPPFDTLAAHTCKALASASEALKHLHGGGRNLRSPSHSFETAYDAAKKALVTFTDSGFIAHYPQAEDGQLHGIASLLNVFSVNARRLAFRADAERKSIYGFVDSKDSKATDVVNMLRRNYSTMMGFERSATSAESAGGPVGRSGAAAQAVLATIVQMLKVYADDNDWKAGTGEHDWARGRRMKRPAEATGQATNNAYQRVGRAEFWFGKPNKNCFPSGWVVENSSDPVYLQQYRGPNPGRIQGLEVTRFALPIDGCSHFHAAQLVSYLFLLGKRVLIYDDDNNGLPRYKEAHQILSTAFRRCYAGARQQKQQILQYLAPAAMLCGTLPSIQLLHKYGLPQLYVDIVESLRYGDLPLYENTLADPNNADWLLRRGLWMVVQALRVVVQARFFWHVKKISEEVHGYRHLRLKLVEDILVRLSGVAAEGQRRAKTPRLGGGGLGGRGMADSVEQMAMRLIDRKYVAGYIKTDERTNERTLIVKKFNMERIKKPPLP